MSIRNLFNEEKQPEVTEAEVESAASDFEAEAGAFDYTDPTKCPKCSATMGSAFAQQESVLYCGNCRVTSPMPEDK